MMQSTPDQLPDELLSLLRELDFVYNEKDRSYFNREHDLCVGVRWDYESEATLAVLIAKRDLSTDLFYIQYRNDLDKFLWHLEVNGYPAQAHLRRRRLQALIG